MTDLDTVAEAIYRATTLHLKWSAMKDHERRIYRLQAQAAIDALGLTEEVEDLPGVGLSCRYITRVVVPHMTEANGYSADQAVRLLAPNVIPEVIIHD